MTAAAASGAAPVLPAYGRSTLADLLPSIASQLGLSEAENVLGLPPAPRYVVLLVDGLGQGLLSAAADQAPFLGRLLADGAVLTSGVPSTTATSVTSIGTGLPPGGHGIVGYTFLDPGSGRLMNALTWAGGPADVERFQPASTIFERLGDIGVATGVVALERHAGSSLTRAALRGGAFAGLPDHPEIDAVVSRVTEASGRGDRSLVYAYERNLDHVGHGQGCGSAAWTRALRRIDALAAALRAALPAEVVLVVTGDHGMVDVAAHHRVTIEDEPELVDGVQLIGGEPRLRQLYCDETATEAVAARWRSRAGDRAWVFTRDEALTAGWFGPVTDDARGRIGNVLIAARGDWAFMTTTVQQEFGLVGMHGSLTAAEMQVPLLVATGTQP